MSENTANIWSQFSNTYHLGNTANHTKILPPGIYSIVHTMQGWHLARNGERFEFPYKVYGNYDDILSRVEKAWNFMAGNLGILLNGIKGTGKTVTAQLIANWATSNQKLPVFVIDGPEPALVEVLTKLEQPVMVIFDEFEKTHQKPEHQQMMLTALDGMARNAHKRLFVFTTNEKNVDANLIDRPSRIRYCWEFKRLEEHIINDLMNDILKPSLSHLRTDIITYLHTRNVLSIDVAKTVINEVNIFEEAPESFGSFMNLSEQVVRGFVIDLLDEKRSVVKTLSSFYGPNEGQAKTLRSFLTEAGQQAFMESYGYNGHYYSTNDPMSQVRISLCAPTSDTSEWVCMVGLNIRDTWLDRYKKFADSYYQKALWIDAQPEGWTIPAWLPKYENGEVLTDEEDDAMESFRDNNSLYGTSNFSKLLVRITPNFVTQFKSQPYETFKAF